MVFVAICSPRTVEVGRAGRPNASIISNGGLGLSCAVEDEGAQLLVVLMATLLGVDPSQDWKEGREYDVASEGKVSRH